MLLEYAKSYIPPTNQFDVSGYVTDENGNDVPEAFLSISEHTPKSNGDTHQNNSYQRNVRTFHVKSTGYAALSLYFTKIGYEDGKLHFMQSTSQHGIHVVMRKQAASP
jgi:hypothetical protein